MNKYLKLLPMIAFVGLVGCGETKFTCTMKFNKSTNNIEQTCNGAEFFGSISDPKELKNVVSVPLEFWNKYEYGTMNISLYSDSKNQEIRQAIINNKISQDRDVAAVVAFLVNRTKTEVLEIPTKGLGNDVIICSTSSNCNFGDLKKDDPKLYDYFTKLDNFVTGLKGNATNSLYIGTGRNKNEVIKQISDTVESGKLSYLQIPRLSSARNDHENNFYVMALQGRKPASLDSLPTVTFSAEDLKQIESNQNFKEAIKVVESIKQQVELCVFDQSNLKNCNGNLSAQKLGNGARGWNIEQTVENEKKNDYVSDIKVEQGKITITSKGISINGDQNITYVLDPTLNMANTAFASIKWKVSDESTCLKYGLCSKGK